MKEKCLKSLISESLMEQIVTASLLRKARQRNH